MFKTGDGFERSYLFLLQRRNLLLQLCLGGLLVLDLLSELPLLGVGLLEGLGVRLHLVLEQLLLVLGGLGVLLMGLDLLLQLPVFGVDRLETLLL